MAVRTVRLSDEQIKMAIYELEQSYRGDDDSYDRRLKNVIKNLKEAIECGKKVKKK